MTEHPPRLGREHPDDELVELALGDVGEPDRSRLIQHLVGCARCRAHYEDLVDVIDTTLPAAPLIAPPVGFEQRTITAMGVSDRSRPDAPPTRRPRDRDPRIRMLVAAAAAVLAAIAGGGVALAIWGGDGDQPAEPTLAADNAPLRTSDGDVVGFAAVSSLGDKPALIVSVNQTGASGVSYHCRILYADGHSVDKEQPWALDNPDGSTWIESTPNGRVVGMELVTEDGKVWAAANLA